NNPPANVHAGDSVTVIVMETNSGDDPLSNVSVTGTPASCATWTAVGAFNGTLAPAASQDFTCPFTAGGAGTTTSWTAAGQGTDSLGAPVPRTGEHEEGTVHSINPKTNLTVVGTPPSVVTKGNSVTITVHEANTGDDALTNVSVTGSPCPTWTPV